MINKISKAFIAFIMLFTVFSIPTLDVKANESEVMPYAAVRIVYPNGSENEKIIVAGWNIKYTVSLTGEYYVDASGNITSENIGARLTNVVLENKDVYPFIKSCVTSISGKKATTTVKVGFVNGWVTLNTYVTYTFTNQS